MSRISIRWARPEDAPQVADVIDRTYQWNVRSKVEQWNGWVEYIASSWPHYRVLTRDGTVVGISKMGARRLRVGVAQIYSAELSEISILPEFQRQGLGSALMDDFLGLMREQGIDLSRLTARDQTRLPFYERFGYFRFPTCFTESSVGGERPTLLGDQSPIRPFGGQSDLVACAELYNWFNEHYACSLIWDPSQGSWSHPYRLVYEDKSGICGYLYADISFGAVAFDRSRPEVFDCLISSVLEVARSRNETELGFQIPQAPEIVDRLAAMQVSTRFVKSYPLENINMFRIVGLDTLFQKLTPELAGRLQSSYWSTWQGVIRICVGSEMVDLQINRSTVYAAPHPSPIFTLEVEAQSLVLLVLGAITVDEVDGVQSRESEAYDVLRVLFPSRIATGGSEIWGIDNLNLTQHPLNRPIPSYGSR